MLHVLEQNEQEKKLAITTQKKIKGLLTSVLQEAELKDDARSFNFEKMFAIKGTNAPKKTQIS